jgi:hypothetical protein
MTRPAGFALVPVFLVLGLAALPAPAQPPLPPLPAPPPRAQLPQEAVQNPLDSGPRARAQFEADQMSAVELARARLETARAEYQVLVRQRDAGKEVTFRMLGASLRLLEAALALLEKNADRAAPFEEHWKGSLETEKIAKSRFDAWTLSPEDYYAALYTRVDAQLAWEQAKAEKQAGQLVAWGAGLNGYGEWWAKLEFEVSTAGPKELARARLEAAGEEWLVLSRQRDAGKEVTSRLLGSSLAVLKAEVAMLEKNADRVAPFERHWKRMLETETIFKRRFARGTPAPEDSYETRYARLDAQLAWEQAKARKEKPAGSTSHLTDDVHPLDAREWARTQFEASAASPKELARARLEAAGEVWLVLSRYRDAGKEVTSRLLGSAAELLEAELALLEKNADRVPAFERHRNRMLETEMLFKARFDAGALAPEDYYATRYASLDAQLALLRAKASRDKK